MGIKDNNSCYSGGMNFAFIDSQNLNLAVRDCGWKLDYRRLRNYLKDKYKVEKAFIFIGYVPGNEALYTYLQQSNYVLIFKSTLLYKKGGNAVTKGNVDAELVLHAMIEYPNYEKALIISGDGDFHCIIEYLQGKDKLLGVITPNMKRYSALLRKFHPHLIFLNPLQKKLQGRNQKEKE
jgi:uncharacterized LabA/DUF88 family protein